MGFLRASQGLGLNWRSSPSEGRRDASIVRATAYCVPDQALLEICYKFFTAADFSCGIVEMTVLQSRLPLMHSHARTLLCIPYTLLNVIFWGLKATGSLVRKKIRLLICL